VSDRHGKSNRGVAFLAGDFSISMSDFISVVPSACVAQMEPFVRCWKGLRMHAFAGMRLIVILVVCHSVDDRFVEAATLSDVSTTKLQLFVC
jgi:hypothetical protein